MATGSDITKQYFMTTSAQIFLKSCVLEKHSVEMLIYDIGGNEIFKELIPKYSKGCSWFVITVEVTSSLSEAQKWVDLLCEVNGLRKPCPIILLLTKIDLERKISSSDAEKFAEKNGISYFECSSILNVGIDIPLEFIAKSFSEEYEMFVKLLESSKTPKGK